MKAIAALAVLGLTLAAGAVRAEGSTDHQSLDALIKASKAQTQNASGKPTKEPYDFLTDYSPN